MYRITYYTITGRCIGQWCAVHCSRSEAERLAEVRCADLKADNYTMVKA